MMGQKHIIIVDDEEAIRHSTSFMLRHAGYLVKTFPGGEPFLDALDREPEDVCVLLDVRMPDIDGLTVLKTVRERGLATPIIILTGHGDVSTAVEAMKLGATDFLEKPYPKAGLVKAIELAFKTAEKGVSSVLAQQKALSKLEVLSGREKEILIWLSRGLTNKTIAGELEISARTVEVHRANLMGKLEADSLSDILRIAIAAGIGM